MQTLATCRVIVLVGLGGLMWSGDALAKTAKACEAEYQANKAEIQASKKLKRDFIAECRAQADTAAATAPSNTGTTTVPNPMAPNNNTAQPNNNAAPAPTTTTPPQRQAARPATRRTTTGIAGKSQYATEAEAKGHCPTDNVVWANLNSHIYHFSGHADYGHTKRGAYMCESETAAAGYRAAKNEKHP